MEPGSYQLTMSVLMTPDKANFSGNDSLKVSQA
jgi:hypothetical protein